MWVLILLSTFHYSSNVSVAHVDGFLSHDACHKAGVRVQEDDASKTVSFTCVSKAVE